MPNTCGQAFGTANHEGILRGKSSKSYNHQYHTGPNYNLNNAGANNDYQHSNNDNECPNSHYNYSDTYHNDYKPDTN